MQEKKRGFLSKEASLIQSMLEQFAPALRERKGAAAYLASVEGILAGLADNLAAARRATADKERAVAERAGQLQELVNAGRRYARAVKELQEEVARNDALRAARGGE